MNADLTGNILDLVCHNESQPETSEISTPSEIAVGTHFDAQYGTKTTSKFGLLTIMQHSPARKHLFLYSQGDRSGLRKPKQG